MEKQILFCISQEDTDFEEHDPRGHFSDAVASEAQVVVKCRLLAPFQKEGTRIAREKAQGSLVTIFLGVRRGR